MRFVLIDETIVSHGYWVKVSGIDLTQFRRNPVMYWMHQRASSWDGQNQVLPIGRWENIKVETINGVKSITADAVFDEKDEFALKIKSKVEGGFVKMASAGLKPISWSDDKKDLKPGQTRATIVKSLLMEASIVDIGANKNAIRLFDEHGLINLSENSNNYIPKINNKSNKNSMKTIALKLGLNENATENEILAAIADMQVSLRDFENTMSQMKAERIAALLANDAVSDENRDDIKALAEVDFALAEKTVNLLKKSKKQNGGTEERLSDFIKQGQKPEAGKRKWEELSEAELIELREKNYAEYEKLYAEHYGLRIKVK